MSRVMQTSHNAPFPEWELLLLCARKDLTPDMARRVSALLETNLVWARLLALAERHRLIPLLYAHLKAQRDGALPEAVMEPLRHRAQEIARRNLLLTGELLRLLRLLGAHQIPVVVYKGPALAASLYGNIALRSFGDLDVLIRGDAIGPVTELLRAEGYLPDCRLGREQQTALKYYENELGFYHAERGVLVEVHWNFRGRHYALDLEPEGFWKRLQPATLMGLPVHTLAPEDLLLLLCVSGTGHGWRHLGGIADLAEMTRSTPDMDWKKIAAQAERLACRRMLWLGLALASDLLDAPLPTDLHAAAHADPAVLALVREVQEQLSAPHARPYRLTTQTRLYLRACDSAGQGLRFGLRTLLAPTSRDIATVSLPIPLRAFYYLMRPLRLAHSGWTKAWEGENVAR